MPRSTKSTHEHARRIRLRGFRRPPVGSDEHPTAAEQTSQGMNAEGPADWQLLGSFGAGLALGLLLGAGATLLFAPRPGEETRALIGERMHRLGDDVADRWDDLQDALRRAARRSRRKMRRGVTRGRWAMEDMRDRYYRH